MDSKKRHLKGSPRRDTFKQQHKNLNRAFYALDIDFAFVEKNPPGIVAFVDYQGLGETLSHAEVLAYNVLKEIAPVFLIQSDNPSEGPFEILEYLEGNPQPEPPKTRLLPICHCENWTELGKWEGYLRKEYRKNRN